MITDYFDAAIRQAKERARVLKGKIPNPVQTAELIGLQRICESKLDDVIARLDYLVNDPQINRPDLLRERIRLFRRVIEDISTVESTGITALSRIHPDDMFLNKVVFRIHQEINFPLLPPAVTCISQHYFGILTSLGLMSVPLAESDFLLHLPDMYHELGHLLFSTENPKVEAFQNERAGFIGAVRGYLREEVALAKRSTGPTEYLLFILKKLDSSWIPWSEELFCDLFALYTVGPAYGWAHLHLTASHTSAPFNVRLEGEHPPDEARMRVLLAGLSLMDKVAEAQAIARKWDELLTVTGHSATPLYRRACPDTLLEQAAIHAFEGTKQIGCVIASNSTGHVSGLLHKAWESFWEAPADYVEWEKQVITAIKRAVQ